MSFSQKVKVKLEVIKDQLPQPQTLYAAYKDIIPAVIKKSKNPDYFIPVQVPNN